MMKMSMPFCTVPFAKTIKGKRLLDLNAAKNNADERSQYTQCLSAPGMAEVCVLLYTTPFNSHILSITGGLTLIKKNLNFHLICY